MPGEYFGKKEKQPLWLLVDEGCISTCVSLMGETAEARKKRHEGEKPADGKVVLRELDDDVNAFINRVRSDCGMEELAKLLAAVSNEAAMLEAAKMRERQAKTSVL